MRVLVCGGRDYADWDSLRDTLDRLHVETPIALVIHGAARGADSLADEWAKSRGVPRLPRPAKWKELGKPAGPIRNAEMLKDRPDLVVAFLGGAGTADMVRKAEAAGVLVMRVPA